jgi:hypothetical protein
MAKPRKQGRKPKKSSPPSDGGSLDRLRQFELERGLPRSPGSPQEDRAETRKDGEQEPA